MSPLLLPLQMLLLMFAGWVNRHQLPVISVRTVFYRHRLPVRTRRRHYPSMVGVTRFEPATPTSRRLWEDVKIRGENIATKGRIRHIGRFSHGMRVVRRSQPTRSIWLDMGRDWGIKQLSIWLDMADDMAVAINTKTLVIDSEILDLVAELDEFKGAWRALSTLAPDRLSALRRVATIESIGSSTRIEGNKLSDRDVEKLLSVIEIQTFNTRDEQEVAGYAAVMEAILASWSVLTLTENHIKQIHGDLLRYSTKDKRHRGEYKKLDNHVVAFDAKGKSVGIVFQTASPFDTPRLMTQLVE